MSVLLSAGGLTIWASVIVFLLIILVLVVIILIAKAKLMPSGNVKIIVNNEKELSVPMGGTLLNTLQTEGIFLSSACGGGGTCGQCRCRVVEGAGEILPTENGTQPKRAVEPLAFELSGEGEGEYVDYHPRRGFWSQGVGMCSLV